MIKQTATITAAVANSVNIALPGNRPSPSATIIPGVELAVLSILPVSAS
jgi:hypothetical protein